MEQEQIFANMYIQREISNNSVTGKQRAYLQINKIMNRYFSKESIQLDKYIKMINIKNHQKCKSRT